jgi:hypothetical protein
VERIHLLPPQELHNLILVKEVELRSLQLGAEQVGVELRSFQLGAEQVGVKEQVGVEEVEVVVEYKEA